MLTRPCRSMIGNMVLHGPNGAGYLPVAVLWVVEHMVPGIEPGFLYWPGMCP